MLQLLPVTIIVEKGTTIAVACMGKPSKDYIHKFTILNGAVLNSWIDDSYLTSQSNDVDIDHSRCETTTDITHMTAWQHKQQTKYEKGYHLVWWERHTV